MRRRRSARLLILNPEGKLLLFRFAPGGCGARLVQSYWATPGGRLEPDETFEQAAIRELFEETGINQPEQFQLVAHREFILRLPSGEDVLADEKFYLVRHGETALAQDGWNDEERKAIVELRWWSRDDLRRAAEPIFPADVLALLPPDE